MNQNQPNYPNYPLLFGSTYNAHSALMAVIWGPGINVAILCAIYSYRMIWPALHGLLTLFACLFSLSTALPILVYTGILPSSTTIDPTTRGSAIHNHEMVGIACMAVISAQMLLGLTTKLCNIWGIPTMRILMLRKVHMIFGYTMVILCKSNSYIIQGISQSWLLLAQDILFTMIIIVRKLHFPRMEKQITPVVKQEIVVKDVRSIKEMDPS